MGFALPALLREPIGFQCFLVGKPPNKEKGEKVEKKVEEDPPSIPKDLDKSDKSISSADTQKDATPPNAGPSIPVDTASAAAADPSIPTPSTTTLPSVRKPNIDPVADPAFLEHKPEGTACKVLHPADNLLQGALRLLQWLVWVQQ